MRPGLVAILGSTLGLRWQGVGVMGHTIESEYKAQMRSEERRVGKEC